MPKKPKKPLEPFVVEGMTAEQILKMSPAEISKLDTRNLSRAVRTVALVANKRIKRLEKQAKKTKEGYVEKKSAKKKIALDALNYITNDGKNKPGFGVGTKNLNQLREEFRKIKEFMKFKTSTIKGAEEVRKKREGRVMGQTREEYLRQAEKEYIKQYKKENKGKRPTKKQIKKVIEGQKLQEYEDLSSKAWDLFRKMLQSQNLPNSPYSKFHGSDELIELAGQLVKTSDDEQQNLDSMNNAFDIYYEEQEAIRQEQIEQTANDQDAFEWSYDSPIEEF